MRVLLGVGQREEDNDVQEARAFVAAEEGAHDCDNVVVEVR